MTPFKDNAMRRKTERIWQASETVWQFWFHVLYRTCLVNSLRYQKPDSDTGTVIKIIKAWQERQKNHHYRQTQKWKAHICWSTICWGPFQRNLIGMSKVSAILPDKSMRINTEHEVTQPGSHTAEFMWKIYEVQIIKWFNSVGFSCIFTCHNVLVKKQTKKKTGLIRHL